MNFGNWLLRSVRGDTLTESPVSVIERLSALRPLRDVDKDTLVGAVLVLGPSLQLALQMLQELLPPDESKQRLGEVLCPTLWLLQNALGDTLRSFAAGAEDPGDVMGEDGVLGMRPEAFARMGSMRGPPSRMGSVRGGESRMGSFRGVGKPSRPSVIPRPHTEPVSVRPVPVPSEPAFVRPTPMSTPFTATEKRNGLPTPPATAQTLAIAEESPDLHVIAPTPGRLAPDSAADLALMKDLRAEMRVNAAIQVAVDSLEFAEGQLRIVKEVNRLKGGSFDLLQRHFYQGYNRILFRALELERREFDSPPYAASVNEDYEPEPEEVEDVTAPETRPQTQHSMSITFQSPLAMPELPPMELPPLPPLSPRKEKQGTGSRNVSNGSGGGKMGHRRTPTMIVRRNTTQGVEGAKRQMLKRRLSLAEELAMVGDESDEDDHSEEGGETHFNASPGQMQSSQNSESEPSSGSDEEEDSEEDSHEEPPHQSRSESPTGDSSSESDGTSVDDDDDNDDDDDDSDNGHVEQPPSLAEAVNRVVNPARGDAKSRKQVGGRGGVISPPTSPESRGAAVAPVAGIS